MACEWCLHVSLPRGGAEVRGCCCGVVWCERVRMGMGWGAVIASGDAVDLGADGDVHRGCLSVFQWCWGGFG